jgi:hypothetical protein
MAPNAKDRRDAGGRTLRRPAVIAVGKAVAVAAVLLTVAECGEREDEGGLSASPPSRGVSTMEPSASKCGDMFDGQQGRDGPLVMTGSFPERVRSGSGLHGTVTLTNPADVRIRGTSASQMPSVTSAAASPSPGPPRKANSSCR